MLTDKQNLARHEAALQRWSILRLVKNCDTEAEQVARKEKMQEKVDEWMTSFCKDMVEKERHPHHSNSYEFGDKLIRKQIIRKKALSEREQTEMEALKRRMQKREKEEAKQERERVLTGNLNPSETYLRTDKVIQIHKTMQNIEQRCKSVSVAKVKKPPVRTKWQYAVHRLHISPTVDRPMFTKENDNQIEEEKGKDSDTRVLINVNENSQIAVDENAIKIRIENNPVYKSFETAKDVDDLYRIAEIWVNPSYEI